MKHRNPTLLFLLLASASVLCLLFLFPSLWSVTSQTRERRVGANNTSAQTQNSSDADKVSAVPAAADIVKVDPDLWAVESPVFAKNTPPAVCGSRQKHFP